MAVTTIGAETEESFGGEQASGVEAEMALGFARLVALNRS